MSESTEQVLEEVTTETATATFESVKTEPADENGTITEEQLTVDEGTGVQYVTMTPEEAEAAGIMTSGEEQVMTTSLQFDPANPSVLYTAEGTPINKEDLSPEERALVETALQQHLAEQEAEQQLAMIDDDQSKMENEKNEKQESQENQSTEKESTETEKVDGDKGKMDDVEQKPEESGTDNKETNNNKEENQTQEATSSSSATELMQSLTEKSKKSEESKAAPMSTAPGAGGIRYEEKIVIRQGQPHVVRVPVQAPKPKPEIPDVLASLMPKVEIGKDGGQVIRIHQSQITDDQLNALKNNPNVRLVYRPPSGTKPTGGQKPRKRGRPRKNIEGSSPESSLVGEEPDLNDEPPAKTRSGRLSKPPSYSKDYLTPKLTVDGEPGEIDRESFDADYRKYKYMNKPAKAYISPASPKRRGRPPLGIKKQQTAIRKSLTYAHKIEALRAQDAHDSNFSVQSIAYNKPALTPIEQAISTRRKNRLTELLGACSADEIMEVALPHLARGFSLWEFLVTKVERNKKSRVHFADVYKEYESLHKYISKLAEKYKEVLKERADNTNTAEESTKTLVPENEKMETDAKDDNSGQPNKDEPSTVNEKEISEGDEKAGDKSAESTSEKKPEDGETENTEPDEKKSEENTKDVSNKEQPPKIKVKCKILAESLGLLFDELEDAEISLVDPQEALGPYIMGTSGQRILQNQLKNVNQDKSVKGNTALSGGFSGKFNEGTYRMPNANKTVQNTPAMPPLKPLGNMSKQRQAETALLQSVINDDSVTMETTVDDSTDGSKSNTQAIATSTVEPTSGAETLMLNDDTTIITAPEGTGPQLIQIGQGDDQQFIEVPEGYSLIQTPEGLVMSQPGTTLTQGEDGAIYITYADGTTTPLSAAQQQSVQMETVESLLSLDGQQSAQ